MTEKIGGKWPERVLLYIAMFEVTRFSEAWGIKCARYFTLILNKDCDDALNVCRVSPRVGVVTVNERRALIGLENQNGPITELVTWGRSV